MHDMAAKAANRALLQSQQYFMLARQSQNQRFIKRLHKTRIDDAGAEALRVQLVSRQLRLFQPCAVAEQANASPFANDAAFADFQHMAMCRQFNADTFAARIAQSARVFAKGDLCRHHMFQLGFISRRHHHHIGQCAEIGIVERTGMGWPISADQTGTVNGEAHRQILHRNIMHHLIISALQKGRVNRGKRFEAFAGQTGGEGYRMLLSDADIKTAFRIFLRKFIQPRTRRHGSGNGDNLIVTCRFIHQRLGKYAGITRRRRLGLYLLAGHDIKFRHAVIFIIRRFGRRIAMSLFGHHMHHYRAVLHFFDVFKNR